MMPAVTPQSIEDFSLERYRPMLRLLNLEEFSLLESQAGSTPEMIADMRRQRCRIFRRYLRLLREDFGQVCLAVKLLMVHAGRGRPDLARMLIRARLQFAVGMIAVEVRLSLYRIGVGKVDGANLLRVFNHVQRELHSLIPSVAAGA